MRRRQNGHSLSADRRWIRHERQTAAKIHTEPACACNQLFMSFSMLLWCHLAIVFASSLVYEALWMMQMG